MSKVEKLKARLKSKPTDFTWSELNTLLTGMGFELSMGGKTGGSRARFVHGHYPPIILHKPHPSPLLKRYQVDQIVDFLGEEGLL